MKVRFTPSGRVQFLAALEYIRRDDPGAAVRFRHAAEKGLRRLGPFPESGRLIPEFMDLPFREVIVNPYRFFYRPVGKIIWVVGVWHGAQIPRAPKMSAGHLTTHSTRRSARRPAGERGH